MLFRSLRALHNIVMDDQLQRFEGNAQELLSRTRINQDQGIIIEIEKQQKASLQQERSRRTRILKTVCHHRKPGRASSKNFNILSTGNKPPRTRAEELAASLYHYIT